VSGGIQLVTSPDSWYVRGMKLRLHLARILGAAIVLIALAIAPSVASAHTGHGHARSAIAAFDVQPRHTSGRAVGKLPTAELKASTGLHSPSSDSSQCHGGACCSGASCATCCAAAVTELAYSTPPDSSSALIIPQVPVIGSLGPDGLRRPPRSFA
jgi:hypothetical protein